MSTFLSALDSIVKDFQVRNKKKKLLTKLNIMSTYAAGRPSMYYLEYYTNSLSTSKSFLAKTSGSPPSNITIYKDNERIDINKSSPIQIETTITNRQSSYYNIIFSICDTPENIIGEYTIKTSNYRGTDSDTINIQGEMSNIKVVHKT